MLVVKACILSLLAAQAPGAQTAPAPESVPETSLHGDTLVVQALNFAVVGPSRWRWTRQSYPRGRDVSGEAFVVTAPSAEAKFLVAALNMPLWHLDDSTSKAFVRGILQSRPPGWQASDVATTRVSVPSAGAMRFQARWTSSDGLSLYQYGYLVPGQTSYVLSATTPERSEPAAFRNMVSSFKSIDSRRSRTSFASVRAIGRPRTIFLVLLGVFAAIEAVIRIGAARSSTPGAGGVTLPARLLILLGVLAAVFLSQLDIPPDQVWAPRSYVVATALGAMTADVAMAAGIAYVAYGRASKRNWTKFAVLFCLVSLVIPILAIVGKAGR
jgi:hypothetical protein